MKIHSYAKYFPVMEGDEFDQLVQDIRERGLREPIVTFEDAILDGRNRYRACLKAGVEPTFKPYLQNGSPLGALHYVVSMNVRRRHLNETQKGIIAQDMLPEFEKEAAVRVPKARPGKQGFERARLSAAGQEKGRSAEHAARMFGIGPRTVQRVTRVAKEAPELLPKMRSGELSAEAAEHEVRMRKAREAVHRDREQAKEKKRQENPREVRAYLDALRAFRVAIKEAIDVARYGKFSPEAQRFVVRWHDDLRDLMKKVEDTFHA